MNQEQPKIVLDVHEKPPLARWLPLSLQHLFAMFGATILVPVLVGISPAVALISSGLGTLVFLFITRGQVPAYLGSSFAFIAPLFTVVQTEGIGQALFGSIFAGIVYGIASLLITSFGTAWIRRLLPPVVVGPVIVVIGLSLAPVAADMAVVSQVDQMAVFDGQKFAIAAITLAITVGSAMFLRGFFGLIPVLVGIIGGYVSALFMGVIDFSIVANANWFALPEFATPQVSWTAVLIIMPVALVTLAEHIGDMMVISKVTDRNLLQKPGVQRTLLGDGLATMIGGLIGGPPNTTYGENVGVLAISRVFSVYVVGGAAVLAIIFGFIGKMSAFIQTIPNTPVMGGVCILLFGIIASSGLRVLIESEVSFSEKRNLIVSSVIVLVGIGASYLEQVEVTSLSGIALSALVGIVLHLLLPNAQVAYGQKSMFKLDP